MKGDRRLSLHRRIKRYINNKHGILFNTKIESLWSHGPVTPYFWKSYSIRRRYSTFRICSASAYYNFRKVTKKAFLKCNFRLLIIGISENRQGSHLIGSKWTINKKNLSYLATKNWFCVCSVNAKMFVPRNAGKFFLEYWPRSYKVLIYANKNLELSHTFKKIVE